MGASSLPVHFTLTLRRGGGSETRDLVLVRHPSESPEGLALRVLAYCLLARPDLEVRDELCDGREPALAVAGQGRHALWVELGWPTRQRLARARRKAERVVVVADRPRPARRELDEVNAHVVERALVSRLAGGLARRNRWVVDVAPGSLAVACEGERVHGTWTETQPRVTGA